MEHHLVAEGPTVPPGAARAPAPRDLPQPPAVCHSPCFRPMWARPLTFTWMCVRRVPSNHRQRLEPDRCRILYGLSRSRPEPPHRPLDRLDTHRGRRSGRCLLGTQFLWTWRRRGPAAAAPDHVISPAVLRGSVGGRLTCPSPAHRRTGRARPSRGTTVARARTGIRSPDPSPTSGCMPSTFVASSPPPPTRPAPRLACHGPSAIGWLNARVSVRSTVRSRDADALWARLPARLPIPSGVRSATAGSRLSPFAFWTMAERMSAVVCQGRSGPLVGRVLEDASCPVGLPWKKRLGAVARRPAAVAIRIPFGSRSGRRVSPGSTLRPDSNLSLPSAGPCPPRRVEALVSRTLVRRSAAKGRHSHRRLPVRAAPR